MSTKTTDPRFGQLATLALAVAVVGTAFAGTWPRDHDTAWGILCGGTLAIVGFLVAILRTGGEGSWQRSVRGEADERDRQILLEAGSWTGGAALGGSALGLVAITWGVDARLALTVLLWAELLVYVGAHLWLQRHR